LFLIQEGGLSAVEVEEEFKDLVEEDWDWQVKKLNDTDFALVFPSKESLCMSIRGGGPTLPKSKLKTIVTLPTGNPLAVERLQEVWVRLYDVPPSLRFADRLLMCTRKIGRPIGVDTDSLAHPLGPVRMSFGLRAPVKLLESVVLFVNMQGYKVNIVREEGAQGTPPPPEQQNRPPSDKGGDKDED
jgi:hypothetical protein